MSGNCVVVSEKCVFSSVCLAMDSNIRPELDETDISSAEEWRPQGASSPSRAVEPLEEENSSLYLEDSFDVSMGLSMEAMMAQYFAHEQSAQAAIRNDAEASDELSFTGADPATSTSVVAGEPIPMVEIVYQHESHSDEEGSGYTLDRPWLQDSSMELFEPEKASEE